MATANELFAANGEDYIVIDSDLRTMTFPASINNIGVENDKDVHKLNFKMPRYFSGYDLSEFIIHINYVNANGDADMYYVLDPTVEENEIIFSWLVGRHACLYSGSVTFIVCLKLADGEGDVAQEFNTTLASLQVLPGLETEPTILETEHDVIEQLLLSINDTNAKIKAVLDTGLTPEQIAEFYNKSKTYDTRIATLNSSIPQFVNGVNQWNGTLESGSLSNKGEEVTIYTRLRSPFVRVMPGSTYYLSDGEFENPNILIYEVHFYRLNKAWIKYIGVSNRFITFATPDDCAYIRFLIRKEDSSVIDVTDCDPAKIMLNISNSEIDGAYSPYEGPAKQSDVTSNTAMLTGRAYSDISTMYTEVIALLTGNQRAYFTISGSLVTALTNSGTSSVCRVIAVKADTETLDYMLWSSGSGVFYTGRIGANATVSQVIKYARQDGVDAINNNLIVPNNRVTIPDGSDINTYITPGVYAVASDASASTMTNIPRAASGKLIVLTRGNSMAYIQQRYITTSSSPNEYIRNFNNGSFTSWELVPRQSDILEKSYVFSGINASSTNNLQQLGMIDVYGVMLAVFRVDGAPDGTSVYVVRRNSAGWQISTLYEGEAINTPVVDSNGILKLKSSSTGSLIHALGIVFAKWT